jgi:hypothetical protein
MRATVSKMVRIVNALGTVRIYPRLRILPTLSTPKHIMEQTILHLTLHIRQRGAHQREPITILKTRDFHLQLHPHLPRLV